MFKKVFTNTLSQIVTKALTASSTLLVTLLLGKSLGPTGYGDFVKIFTFVGYFYILIDFGFNSVYIRLSSERPHDSENLLKSLLALRLILSIILALSAIVISQLLPASGFNPIVKNGIIIASFTIITQAFVQTAAGLFQKKLSYHFATISAVLSSISLLIVVVANYFTKSAFEIYIVAYVISGIIFAISSTIIIKRFFNFFPQPLFNIRDIKEILNIAWPIGISLIFNLIYFRADVLILTFTRSQVEVGYYGFAYQFFETALTIPIYLTNALLPVLAALKVKDFATYRKSLRKWFFVFAAGSAVVTTGLLIVSVLIPLYDQRFIPSQSALTILALGMPFFFLSAFLWHIILVEGKQKALIFVYATGAVFNLILNLILIPRHGFVAAAIVTIVSEFFVLILLAMFVLKQTQKPEQASPS